MVDVSIIVTCGEQQEQLLRQLLPPLLSQQYDGEHEVIVVDKMHDKDLGEWLEEMEAQFPHLSHTFCPASSRGIDLHKLALTLGAKAANYEWLVVLPSPLPASPLGEDWISSLVANIDDQAEVVICTQKGKRQWGWFRSIFRRTFALFRPTSAVILCRRSILLKAQVVKLSSCKIVK